MDQLVLIGKITRLFGFKGGLALKLLNPSESTLSKGMKVTLIGPHNALRIETLYEVMPGGRCFFLGIHTDTDARTLIGYDLYVAREDLPELDEHEYYLNDLLSMTIVDQHGEKLGTVVGFSHNNAQDLLEIELQSGKKASIPLVQAIVTDIDFSKRVITADVPEGLLEL